MDNRYWSKNEINHQLKNYNNYFEEKKCFTKTYLVSPLGKYGYSEDEFLNILEKFINGNNLKDPKYPQGYNKLEKKKEDNISKDSLDYFSVLATVLTLENPKKLCMYPREYSWARKNGLLDHFYNDFKD